MRRERATGILLAHDIVEVIPKLCFDGLKARKNET